MCISYMTCTGENDIGVPLGSYVDGRRQVSCVRDKDNMIERMNIRIF